MEKLLKVKQVAELLQVSKRTIYDWAHTEFIPHYKFPKGIRFRSIEVFNWIKKRHRKGRNSYKIEVSEVS